MPTFKNFDGKEPKIEVGSFLKWKANQFFSGQGPKASGPFETPRVEPALTRIHAVQEPSLTWIGHATYLVQLKGRSILTDPVLGSIFPVVRRNAPLGIEVAALPKIDIVTISHNHRDHLDVASIKKLGSAPTYLVPLGLKKFIEDLGATKVIELNWWESAEVDGVQFTLVPSQHWSKRSAFDTNKTLWGGWVMRGERTVWHAGDTAYFEGFKEIGARIGQIDAALLPIGAYEPRWFMKSQHMNPHDAVQAFLDSKAHLFCAMHWGTFKLTDEPLDEPPKILLDIWREKNLAPERLFLAKIGESYWW
jgi:L-ascorbate metabolism protein UlaG (beta-lactamase superfamily)